MTVKMNSMIKLLTVGTLLMLSMTGANGYPFLTTLHSFTNSSSGQGAPVSKLMLGSDKNIYGTAWQGGSNNTGVVFRLAPTNFNSGILTGIYTNLHSFDGTDGANPYAGMLQESNYWMYGVTTRGGDNNGGTFFKMNPDGSIFTNFFSFSHGYGEGPISELVKYGRYFWGTLSEGGAAGYGSVFAVDMARNIIFFSESFTAIGSNGGTPYGALIPYSSTNWYVDDISQRPNYEFETNYWSSTVAGTAHWGGDYDAGCVYTVENNYTHPIKHDNIRNITTTNDRDGTVYATLYSFTGGADGANPYGGLVKDAAGNFYGTTVNGGAYGLGTVFALTVTSNANGTATYAQSVLHSFSGLGEGAHPYGQLMQGPGAGNFYGTTLYGGSGNNGTIFNIRSTGAFTNLYSFTGIDDGANPLAGLTPTANPRVYCGSTGGSAAKGVGTIYEFIADAARVTVVADPSGGGFVNVGSVVQAGGTSTATGVYPVGQLVWISALGNTNGNWSFYMWNDGITDNPRAVQVSSSDVTYTASFRTNALVTVQASPNNGGSVTGGGSYPIGSLQQITATPNTGWSFVNWNGDSTLTNSIFSFTVPAVNTNFTANFTRQMVTVSVAAKPANAGTVSIGNAGGVSGLFQIGSSQSISATPNAMWKFGSWDDGDTNPWRTITIPAINKTYTASFVPQDPVTITVVANPTAGGTTTGGGSYVPGTTQTISIAVTLGWTFTGWSDGSTQTTYSVVIPTTNTTYTATLSQISSLQVQAAATISTLRAFTGTSDGGSPRTGLVQGDDGYFYGTTYTNGAYGKGTVFKVNSGGNLITLRHFGSAINDGANPLATLLKGGDGYFYGTTYAGGSATLNNGTIFRINSSGSSFNTMYSFNGGTDGANPSARLVRDSSGNLFGTTQSGGANNNGTVFYLIPSWAEYPLYKFSGLGDGNAPYAGLVMGNDGIFYGTTSAGGSGSVGAAFKLSLVSGKYVETTLHSFNGSDGNIPYAGLIQGADGYFYGTSWNGGTGSGNIFRMDNAGGITSLHPFAGTEGINPRAKLVQGANGCLYGTTQNGGANGYGAIYRITTGGTFTSVYSFTGGTDGRYPWGELIQGSDGYFYGTTSSGGASGFGTVFRMAIPDPATVTVQTSPTNSGTAWVSQSGASIILTASTNNGWTFTGWNDGNTSLQRTIAAPPTNVTYTANFGTQAVVNVTASPLAGGTTTGSGTYISGTNITISATANSGWIFTGWDDGNTNTLRLITIPIGGTNFVATFTNAATLTVQTSSNLYGSVTGGGTYASNSVVQISANIILGGRFVGWSDGDTNSTRALLVVSNTTLTANFTNAPMYVLLQAGNGGMAGQWTLGTNYLPNAWLPMSGPLGGGWIVRAINQHRALLQAGNGGMIGLWDLNSSGTPTNWWMVSGALPGWIARDLDGNRVLLQAGDGGMVGIWKLGASNTPTNWYAVSAPISGLIARALTDNRILLQFTSGATIGYWVLDGSYNITAWSPITAALPAGWVLRSTTPNYMLLQAGDGGMTGMWDLDASGNPTAWHMISGPLPGWIMRGIDQP
ncbi:MAG: hypothetical protein EPN23_04020 [Verrucomicrobia bacterium]|nr:MAG: hypothetical protein EPN23_04020 [Verrucomicrobiota bacterium]